jgi:hypothetical protein
VLAGGLKWSERVSLRTAILLGVGSIPLQALVLLAMGLPAICTCGYSEL